MRRMKNIRDLLRKNQIESLLLTSEANRRYFSPYNIAEGMMMISQGENCFFTDSRYIEAAQKNMKGFRVSMVSSQCTYADLIKKFVQENYIGSIGYEENHITAGTLDHLKTFLERQEIAFVPAQELLSQVRQVKTEAELDNIRKAQEITDQTFSDILKEIRPGITEKDLKIELLYRLGKNGAEEPAFDPVVVSGPNTSMPHGVASDRILQNGDFITLDFGAKWNGYCADMTRTVALGEADKLMRRVYDLVLRAQEAGIAATKAGVTGAEIDEASRKVFRAEGFEEYMMHSHGHGIGLEVHEGPNCSPSWTKKLKENCVCSAEPGIYLEGMFGVRIEDLVIIKKDGCENITKSPKSLIIL